MFKRLCEVWPPKAAIRIKWGLFVDESRVICAKHWTARARTPTLQMTSAKSTKPVKSSENMSKNDVLRVKLEVLKREHRDLALEDELTPNIIA